MGPQKLEKMIVLVAIGVFIISSLNLLSALGDTVTEEEAIEISKKSYLVKEGFTKAHVDEANFYNWSTLQKLKNWTDYWASLPIPEGHDIWQVIWYINQGVGGYLVIVTIDAQNGVILHEEKGVQLLKST
jgi:hypothetical protein